MHLLAKRFIFGSDDRGFLKDGVNAYLMAPMSPLLSPIFFCLHIYSLWPLVRDTRNTLVFSQLFGLWFQAFGSPNLFSKIVKTKLNFVQTQTVPP